MLLHLDGFDSHATGTPSLAAGSPKWGAQSNASIVAAAGKFGGKALRLAAAGGSAALVLTLAGTIAAAFYAKLASLTTVLLSNAAGSQTLLDVQADGSVRVYDGGGTLRGTSATGLVAAGTFFWFEVAYQSGAITVLVNGQPVISYVGAYTLPAGLALKNSAVQVDYDDLVVWDDQGSYMNTFGLSPRRIHLLQPDGNGASTQWTPNVGPNYADVTAPDWGGGDGVVAEAAGLKDLYSLSDLAATPANINAVVVRTLVENTGDNPANLLHSIRTADGQEQNANAQAVPTGAPAVLESVFYRDPNAAAWTPTTVNGLQAGMTSSN